MAIPATLDAQKQVITGLSTLAGVQALGTATAKNFWDGIQGPMGVKGDAGVRADVYALVYCEIAFRVQIEKGTFDLIEDAKCLTKEELDFIKIINEKEWDKIRKAWCEEWRKRYEYSMFERGDVNEITRGF